MEIDVKYLVNRKAIRKFFVGLSNVKLRLILGSKYPYRADLDSCVDSCFIDSVRLNQSKIHVVWVFLKKFSLSRVSSWNFLFLSVLRCKRIHSNENKIQANI